MMIRAIIILVAGLLISCTNKVTEKSGQSEKPHNVLFIAIDDLRTELNCYGAKHIKSPNIDRLASSGVRFENAHVQMAICMASRASILSGYRPERFGIYTGEAVKDMMPDVLTLNKMFQQNGYDIASFGKIYHYAEDTKQQFGDHHEEAQGAWVGKGYLTAEAIKQKEENERNGQGPAYESADVPDSAYMDGANTLNAIRKLQEFQNSDKPFFMALGLTKPHLPFCAPQKYWDMYPEDAMELAELKTQPENATPHTVRTQGELGNYAGMPQHFADVTDSTALILRRAYFACVSYADAQVGKLMDELDRLGLRENTMVVLWGDHGYKLGDYGVWSKWSNLEIDTRIPLIFSTPNGPKNAVARTDVEALDIYPTLAELCSLDIPSHLEGQSLAPLINDPNQSYKAYKKYAHTLWPHHRWTYDKTIMGYSVKNDRFNYTEWVKLSSGEVLARELYDHENDPQEMVNVISEPKYADDIEALAAQCLLRKNDTDHNHSFKKLR